MLLPATFGVALLSALLPFVNIELYLGALATRDVDHLWIYAVAAAAGQTLGKVGWYVAALRSMDSAWVQKKLAKPSRAAAYSTWQARMQGRPWFAGAVILAAGSLGVPPMLVMAVVAGTLRMPLHVFIPTCFVGRAARFYVIVAGVSVIALHG